MLPGGRLLEEGGGLPGGKLPERGGRLPGGGLGPQGEEVADDDKAPAQRAPVIAALEQCADITHVHA